MQLDRQASSSRLDIQSYATNAIESDIGLLRQRIVLPISIESAKLVPADVNRIARYFNATSSPRSFVTQTLKFDPTNRGRFYGVLAK